MATTLAKISKVILGIAIAIVTLLAIGWVGQLDHDEYIEVNSNPITRLP